MSIYLRAKTQKGMRPPWVWVRSKIAEAWGIPPPDVDEYPAQEIALQLRLWRIAHDAEEFKKQRPGGANGKPTVGG